MTIIFDWFVGSIMYGVIFEKEIHYDRVMKAFRAEADQIDWVAKFKEGGFKGVLLPLQELWHSSGWRQNVPSESRGWFRPTTQSYLRTEKELDERCINDYLRQDIAPTLRGWLHNEIEENNRRVVQTVDRYVQHLMKRTVRIHLRPSFRDFRGGSLRTQIPISVQGQMPPFTPVMSPAGIRPVPPKGAYVDLIVKAGNTPLDLQYLTLNRFGGEVQVVIETWAFLRALSQNGDRLDVDAVLHRDGLPDMDLPVWPFPLRIDDRNAWYTHGLVINHKDQETHLDISGGVRIVLPTAPLRVKVKRSNGEVCGGALECAGSEVKTDASGTAIMRVPSAGMFWISHAFDMTGISGNGIRVDGSTLDPVQLSRNQVEIIVPSGAGAAGLPPLPPLPKVEVSSDIQDANTAITLLESRKNTYDETTHIYHTTQQHISRHLADVENQWQSYEKALTARLNQAKVPWEQIKQTVQERRDTFFQEVTQARQTAKAVEARMSAAQANIIAENERRQIDIRLVAGQMSQHVDAAADVVRDVMQALGVAHEKAQPRTFAVLSEIEADRAVLSKWISKIEQQRSRLSQIQVALGNTQGAWDRELEAYGGFLHKAGSFLRFDSARRFLQGQAVAQVRQSATISALTDFGEDRTCDRCLKNLHEADRLLSWLQLRSLEQLQVAEELDQLLDAAPPFLKADPAELVDVEAMKTDVHCLETWRKKATQRGTARRPKEQPHNGFGMDAYEHYQELPERWANLEGRLEARCNASNTWAERVSAKLDEIKTHLARLFPKGWGVREVARALEQRKDRPVELGRRDRLVAALAWGREALPAQAAAQAQSELAGSVQWNDHLRANLEAVRLLERARAAAQRKDGRAAQRLLEQARQTLPDILKAGKLKVPLKAPAGSPTTYTHRAPAAELWMLMRVEDLFEEVDRSVAELDHQRSQQDQVELTIVLRGSSVADVGVEVVDAQGIRQALTMNPMGDRRIGTLAPGSCTLRAQGRGLRISPHELTFAVSAGQKKTVTLDVTPALEEPGGGAIGGAWQDLGRIYPISRVMALNLGTSNAAPSFAPDGTYLVVDQVSADRELLRVNTIDHSVTPLIQGEPNLPFGTTGNAKFGATEPIAIGPEVVYRVGARWMRPGRGSIEFYASVPHDGGKAVMLFQLDGARARVIDAAVTDEPEFLVLADWGGRNGWHVLRGHDPKPDGATFLVRHPFELLNFDRVAVSRNWQVFAAANPGEPNSWTLFDQSGGILSTTPVGMSWLRLQLGPEGKFFAVTRTNAQTGDTELAIGAVDDPTRLVQLYSASKDIGRPGWSADRRFLAARIFGSKHQEELRLFDLLARVYRLCG